MTPAQAAPETSHATVSDTLTHVELLWVEKRIERWIRFGQIVNEHILDRRRCILSFALGSVFAFVRWAASDYGTVVSCIDILRAVGPGEPLSTVPFVRPSGEILQRISGWPKVERVQQAIDAIEQLGIVAPIFMHPVSRLLWNASASVPVGLYAVHPAGQLSVGELIVVTPPEPLASFLNARRYLPKGVPLLKHILALPGQAVCRMGRAITINGVAVGDALDRDRRGRPLPVWQGCRTIATGEVFLMNPLSRDSFDSRYFGPLPICTIIGRADPLWLRSAQ